eukprot:2040838-Rhodomonas_salina.3
MLKTPFIRLRWSRGVQNLMEKYNIAPTDVGRLEVGTETIIDKSKSVKSTMFEPQPQTSSPNASNLCLLAHFPQNSRVLSLLSHLLPPTRLVF